MAPRDSGGSAFPKYFGGNVSLAPGEEAGMSLRDYFAGQALAECIRLASTMRPSSEGGSPVHPRGVHTLPWPEPAAKAAYAVADAMLAERTKV